MYIGGATTDTIYEYDLATPFVTSTATDAGYSFKHSADPLSLKFSPDGTKMLMAFGQGIVAYNLSEPFSIATATLWYSEYINWSGTQFYGLYGFDFNNDGTKITIVDGGYDTLYQYNLTYPYDVRTRTNGGFLQINAKATNPREIVFNNDGTKIFVVCLNTDQVHSWDLPTAYIPTGGTFSQSLSTVTGAYEYTPVGLKFNPDGTKMYVIGSSQDAVKEWNLSTAFDLSTASFSTSYSVSSKDTNPYCIAFNLDTLTADASNLTTENFIGFSNGAYSNGQTATIDIVGTVNSGQSGLVAGKNYYVAGDGSLTASPGGPEAGYAISPTEIVVKGAYSSVPAESDEQAAPLKFDLNSVSKGTKLIFTSSTTWTPSATVLALVTVVGAGANGQNTTANSGAYGGGAGGLCQGLLTLSAGETYSIAVGAGFGTNGGSSTFSGPGFSLLFGGGASGQTGGAAAGGNIVNNRGGNGNPAAGVANNFQGGGGGAIGIRQDGASATTYIGASIDMVPSTFPYSEAEGFHLTNADGNVGGGHFGGQGYAAYTYGLKIGAKGGVGSGGGGSGGYSATHSGGGGGFPGGGGGGVSGENPRAGYGAFGCVVIEVL
jgi:hypothetical protein